MWISSQLALMTFIFSQPVPRYMRSKNLTTFLRSFWEMRLHVE